MVVNSIQQVEGDCRQCANRRRSHGAHEEIRTPVHSKDQENQSESFSHSNKVALLLCFGLLYL